MWTGTFYRIHRADEPLARLLDPRRPDGWVASDEEYETQPLGVSCCASLADLAAYCQYYSLTPQPGDLLVRLRGRLSPDRDRDRYAQRCLVESYEVLGDACAWLEAARVDLEELRDTLEAVGEDGSLYDSEDEVWAEYEPAVQQWLRRRLAATGA